MGGTGLYRVSLHVLKKEYQPNIKSVDDGNNTYLPDSQLFMAGASRPVSWHLRLSPQIPRPAI